MTTENNRLANTKERDASIDLDNHGFRYYDPSTGRYLTRDPIGYAVVAQQLVAALVRYSYGNQGGRRLMNSRLVA